MNVFFVLLLDLILYPLKIPKNQQFSGVFKEYKMRTNSTKGIQKIVEGTKKNTKIVLVFKSVTYLCDGTLKVGKILLS